MKRSLLIIALLAVLPLFADDVRLIGSKGGATLTWAGGPPATVRVTLLFDPERPGPAVLTLRARETGQGVQLPLSAPQLLRLRTLVLPPGWYELSLTLPHYRIASRSFHAAGESLALGGIVLTPAPVITGVVRRAGGSAVAGASVNYGEGNTFTTPADGRFAIEITEKWPDTLIVRKPGFGTKYVPLSATEASVALPLVELSPAGSVRVVIRRGAFDGPLDVSLGIHDEGSPARWLTRQSAGRGNSVVFHDLDAGSYAVLVAGPQPLERMVKPINVGAGDTRELVMPLSFVLAHGRLTMGGKPLAGMNVRFESINGGWNSTVVTNGAGEVTTPIWQTGSYAVSIRKGDWGSPIVRDVDLDAQSFADFAIDVPDRRISGRVLDEEGAAVANALIVLRAHADRITRTIRMYTGDDGRFEFNGVTAGEEELRVLPPGFLRPNPRKFSLAESDRWHDETITVQRGSERQIRVVGRDGVPVSRAEVVIASGDRTRASAITDESGRARISAPSSGESIVFVFPKEGSLAARRLGGEDRNVRIDVPAPNASIDIATLTTDGTSVPNVDLLVRYNGEILPPDVLREIHSYRGLSFETDERGAAHVQHLPSGTYEFWPYRSDNEAESLLATVSGMAAPIVVNAGTGENKVTVRFRKK
jgi:hypothetical protein